MVAPVVKFNHTTGSNTAASGAGPTTAVTGTGASLSASTSVDLSADSPDLSGVATDGSAALWVSTSSGRQFAKITGVDNGTKIVTVSAAYGVTESGRSWAIGGKRASLYGSKSILESDGEWDWVLELASGYFESFTAAIAPAINGHLTSYGGNRMTIRPEAGYSTRPRLDCTYAPGSHGQIFYGNSAATNALWLDAIDFEYNYATGNGFASLVKLMYGARITNCYFKKTNTGRILGLYVYTGGEVRRCTFEGLGNSTNYVVRAFRDAIITDNVIRDNVGGGLQAQGYLNGSIIRRNIIANNTGVGLNYSEVWGGIHISQNVIDSNGGDGINISYLPQSRAGRYVENNQITNNGAYGVVLDASPADYGASVVFRGNNHYGNVSGLSNYADIDWDATNTNSDPAYTDEPNGDYTSGLGQVGLPNAACGCDGTSNTSRWYQDVGVQQQAGGGVAGASRGRTVNSGGI